jgi:hypothetical protein
VQWAALLALGSLALTADAAGQASAWKMVGQIGGPTQGIAVQGGYAYVGVGMRLVVLDVSNPSDLREVGATQPFSQAVEDVALSGTLAYVAAGGAGLRVIDVSDPALPTEIGAWDSRGYAQGVAVAEAIAYVADGPYGLRLVDISKPSQPMELGSAYSMNYAFDVAVQGPYAYVAAAGAGLLIAGVSDPRHPVEAGSLVTNGYAYGVAVAGSTVYLADGWEGVKTVNVTDPAHPALAGAYKTPGWAFGVTITGTTAYVADAFGGLRVLDVTSAAQPVETGSSMTPGGHAGSVAVDGTTAFVADRNWGVHAVDLSAGPDLPQAGSFHPVGYADGLAISGTYAYIAESNVGFFVIDISDRTRPRLVGSCSVDGNARDVAVRGGLAYLTTKGAGSAGLHVIDITDPTRPARIGLYGIFNGQPKGLDLAGDYAYVVIETGLEILNVSDPYRPVRTSFLRMQETEGDFRTAVGVTVAGTLAYVALERGGLAIVDISDPEKPVLRGSFDPGSSFLIRDIGVSASHAYVADTGFGLRVLDISDPRHPFEVGALRTPGPHTLSLVGSLAYLACGDDGLLVVDVADPSRPALVESYRTSGFTRKAVIDSERAYLADGPTGLLILESGSGATNTGGFYPTGRIDFRPFPPSGKRPDSRPPPPQRSGATTTASAIATVNSAAPGSCLVISVADSGAGTFRQCLLNAGPGTTITFDPAVFPPAAPASIRLASGLPGVPGGVTVDGSDAGVILDGSGLSAPPGQGGAFGLFINSDGNTIRGLQILGFPANGIQINGSDNLIGGDRTVGLGPIGQGNVISGNRNAGIMISGDGGTASRNVVIGNFIGTDASGTKPMGNGTDGVWVQRGRNNRIGGPDRRDGNVVSANGFNGIILSGQATGNLVSGNYVGTDITGSLALGNEGLAGIMIGLGAFANVLQGNLTSGNLGSGVGIDDAGSSYNAILGNRIGTDATGTRAIPNRAHGVWLNEPLSGFNRIGGTRPEERNIVSGNLGAGMAINSSGNVVLGNFVGTDITGRNPLGNADNGVGVVRSPNMIGGATPQEANVIAANGGFGVGASGYSTMIVGNHIGTDPSGQVALGNTVGGVTLGGRHSVVQGNVIAHTAGSGNRGGGSGISFSAEFDCTIRRNSIHDNAGIGIQGAAEPPAPIITAAGSRTVTGTACPGCEVEIFSDAEDEGRVFEGATVAEGSGAFVFSDGSGYLAGPNVTATATDRDGRTSTFSAPVRVPSRPPRRHLGRR